MLLLCLRFPSYHGLSQHSTNNWRREDNQDEACSVFCGLRSPQAAPMADKLRGDPSWAHKLRPDAAACGRVRNCGATRGSGAFRAQRGRPGIDSTSGWLALLVRTIRMGRMGLPPLAKWVALVAISACPAICCGQTALCAGGECAGDGCPDSRLPACGGSSCLCAGALLPSQSEDEAPAVDLTPTAAFDSEPVPQACVGFCDVSCDTWLSVDDPACAVSAPLLI